MGDGSVERLRIAHNKLTDEVGVMAERLRRAEEYIRYEQTLREQQRAGRNTANRAAREQLFVETKLQIVRQATNDFAWKEIEKGSESLEEIVKIVARFERTLMKEMFRSPASIPLPTADVPESGFPMDVPKTVAGGEEMPDGTIGS